MQSGRSWRAVAVAAGTRVGARGCTWSDGSGRQPGCGKSCAGPGPARPPSPSPLRWGHRGEGVVGGGATCLASGRRERWPDRPDERARIEAVGGRVLFVNGLRVRGILAMTRALGDRLLRPEVISEPEVTITARTEEDECLILASDGMWDMISNEIACNVARHCLEDGGGGVAAGPEPVPAPSCFRAASLLARLALGRESHDNVSVVVIDLKQRRG